MREHRNRRRLENEAGESHHREKVSHGEDRALAHAVGERARRIGRRRIHKIVKSIERHRDRRSSRETESRRQNLSGAQNQQSRREIADAVRKNSRQVMPVSFRQLREARNEAGSVMAVVLPPRRHQHRECNRRGQPWKQSPTKHVARPQPCQKRRRAQRAEHRADRIHRALEAKRAALLLRRHGVGKQRIARRAAAAASRPAQRAHH